MKRCSRCEREIPESAATCGQCGDQSVALVPFTQGTVAPLEVSAPRPVDVSVWPLRSLRCHRPVR